MKHRYPRFVSRSTVEYDAAVSALRRLPEGLDRAYAEVAAADHEDGLARAGYRRASGHPCIWRLLGRRCRHLEDGTGTRCWPPATDHASLWLRNGVPEMFLSEPYGLNRQAITDMSTFAYMHDLHIQIAVWPTPHFPGRTLSVRWTRQ